MVSFKNILSREQDPNPSGGVESTAPRQFFDETSEEDGPQQRWAKQVEGTVEAIVSFRMEIDVNNGKERDELAYYEDLVREANERLKVGSRRLTLPSERFLKWWEQEKDRIIAQRSK